MSPLIFKSMLEGPVCRYQSNDLVDLTLHLYLTEKIISIMST